MPLYVLTMAIPIFCQIILYVIVCECLLVDTFYVLQFFQKCQKDLIFENNLPNSEKSYLIAGNMDNLCVYVWDQVAGQHRLTTTPIHQSPPYVFFSFCFCSCMRFYVILLTSFVTDTVTMADFFLGMSAGGRKFFVFFQTPLKFQVKFCHHQDLGNLTNLEHDA